MTSLHDANASEGRNTARAHQGQRHEDGIMENNPAAAITQATNSEYGSDFSVPPLSDYGSDIDLDGIEEDAQLGNLIGSLAASAHRDVAYPSIENSAQDEDSTPRIRRRVAVEFEERAIQSSPLEARTASAEVDCSDLSRRAYSVPREAPPSQIGAMPERTPSPDDTRTPLERFRTKPRKPLSVTDLVSPAWCELQYSYTLSKFGRKPRTQAMKQGSKIHQALEDEVFTEITVETVSKEDKFGLRMWNTIQRLRALRETGLTRELEIWGIVAGQVVNGVIDELSFACPDSEMEEKLEGSKVQKSGGTLPLGQLSIEQAFGKTVTGPSASPDGAGSGWLGNVEKDRQVYICDMKTRSAHSLPSKSASRQTWMQLMLYRKLLESLTLNTVDAETVFARYDRAPLESFSEAFMSQGGAMGAGDVDYDPENPYAVLQVNELRSYPNLLALWSLMISEFQQTIPTMSDILRAEYRYSKTGEIIGNELMVYSADTIDTYIKEEMEWWKGEREAKGVEIEEAFKCRMCDFAEICTWRKSKIEEATEKYRLRKGSREKSAV
ncbi:hypothetical protein BU23DRAFT_548706 [Bimuria novae-zelandiae CBS 107.79]|uniref:Exonuclease V n=1 Tax=Bimuria novae-zelandiae CBS 107.79 TaxID=1447943 RepID=A0A6A5VQ91_9PLEO|nr:hypothetical protein BU23DRAFT_548706 [Bimuria novae-zelandiae CBS 107.79]